MRQFIRMQGGVDPDQLPEQVAPTPGGERYLDSHFHYTKRGWHGGMVPMPDDIPAPQPFGPQPLPRWKVQVRPVVVVVVAVDVVVVVAMRVRV